HGLGLGRIPRSDARPPGGGAEQNLEAYERMEHGGHPPQRTHSREAFPDDPADDDHEGEHRGGADQMGHDSESVMASGGAEHELNKGDAGEPEGQGGEGRMARIIQGWRGKPSATPPAASEHGDGHGDAEKNLRQ